MLSSKLSSFTFIILALMTMSCRKTDSLQEQPEIQTIQEKFFNSHRSSDPTEKAIVEFMKREDRKTPFIEKTVGQIGYPFWDKAIRENNIHANSRSAPDSIDVIYIPFVIDSQDHVNASMIVKITPSDTSFSYLCDWQYSERENTMTSSTDSAEYYAVFFMLLDKHVFNRKRFVVTDSSLFRSGNHRAAYVELTGNPTPGGRVNLIAPVEHCQDVTIYFVDCPYLGVAAECTPRCDRCNLCLSSISYEYCWTEYVSGGGSGNAGSGSNDGGSGGTGGGGSPTPPTCGGPTAGRVSINKSCTPGWSPDLTPVESHPSFMLAEINIDSLTDPCLSDVVNLIGQSGHQSFLANLYHQFFGTGNDTYNLVYQQDSSLTGVSGNPVPGHSDLDTLTNGTIQWTITLNPNLLKNASKEYIATVIFHELVHSFISFRFPGIYSTASAQHQFIFEKWVPSIARGVKEAYPNLSDSDYIALALQGLDDATLIQTGPNTGQVNPTNNAYSIQYYQMDILTSRSIALPFLNGTSGTTCP